jgi:hypothetical protein
MLKIEGRKKVGRTSVTAQKQHPEGKEGKSSPINE